MANPPRAKGTRFESALIPFLRRVWPNAERTGSRAYELGDFARTGRYAIEAKNQKAISLASFMDQAKKAAEKITAKEFGHYAVPVVIISRRNKSTAQSYVVYELEDWIKEREQCACFD